MTDKTQDRVDEILAKAASRQEYDKQIEKLAQLRASEETALAVVNGNNNGLVRKTTYELAEVFDIERPYVERELEVYDREKLREKALKLGGRPSLSQARNFWDQTERDLERTISNEVSASIGKETRLVNRSSFLAEYIRDLRDNPIEVTCFTLIVFPVIGLAHSNIHKRTFDIQTTRPELRVSYELNDRRSPAHFTEKFITDIELTFYTPEAFQAYEGIKAHLDKLAEQKIGPEEHSIIYDF